MRLVDLVLSWLRVRTKLKPVPRRYPMAECPVCYRWVATSALSPTRHRCHNRGPCPHCGELGACLPSCEYAGLSKRGTQ